MTPIYCLPTSQHNVSFKMKLNQVKLCVSSYVGTRKSMKGNSQCILLPHSGDGKSINCTQKGRKKGFWEGKTHSKAIKSKHMFKSNNMVTAAGNGKTMISNGAGDWSRNAGWLQRLEQGCIWGVTDSISLRASGMLLEQRLFQIKN